MLFRSRRVLREGLKPYLADNSQAWEMNASGEYRIKPTRRARICAQELLLSDMGAGAISAT